MTIKEAIETGAVRVNRAFNSMPFGGGLGFRWIAETDSEEIKLGKIGYNLEVLSVCLVSIGRELNTDQEELRTIKAELRAVGKLFTRLNSPTT